jgi:hypothetical protein
MEVVFGSESILSKEHLTLAQASQTIEAYGFADALIDHKALVEALSRLLGRTGHDLLERVAAGSLRFRLLRGRPSHEKLYLMCGASGWRVLTGSANLGRAAFEGWQHEILIVFDDEPAWRLFDGYYQRDWKDSVPVAPESLVAAEADGALEARGAPLPLEEVPIVRALSAGIALVDPPPRPAPAGFAAEALRQASVLGAQLKDLVLPRTRPAARWSTPGRCCALFAATAPGWSARRARTASPAARSTSRPGLYICRAPAGWRWKKSYIFADRAKQGAAKDRVVTIDEVVAREPDLRWS